MATEALCPFGYEPSAEIPGLCCRVQKMSTWARVAGCPTGWKPARYTENYCVSQQTPDCFVGGIQQTSPVLPGAQPGQPVGGHASGTAATSWEPPSVWVLVLLGVGIGAVAAVALDRMTVGEE